MISVSKSSSKKIQSSNQPKSSGEVKETKKEHRHHKKEEQSQHQTSPKTQECQQECKKECKEECEPVNLCDKCITFGDLFKLANYGKNINIGPGVTFQNLTMFYTLLFEQAMNNTGGVCRKYCAHLVNLPGFKGNWSECQYTYEGLKLIDCKMVFAGLPPNQDWNIQIANDCDYISNIQWQNSYPHSTSVFSNQVTLQLLHVPFQSVSTLLPEFDINEVCVNVNKGDDTCPFPPTSDAPYVKDAIVGTINGNVLTISAINVNAILFNGDGEGTPEGPTPGGHTTGITFLYMKRND